MENNFINDTSNIIFLKDWKIRYREDFYGYDNYNKNHVLNVLDQFLTPETVVLEIGIGGGLWTEFLLNKCKHVIGLDLYNTPPPHLNNLFTYINIPDRDFTCYKVLDSSVDFVFSFGVFCHLSINAQKCYLKNIYRVLKSGGIALICFANYDRHLSKTFDKLYMNEREPELAGYGKESIWFCNNLDITKQMIEESGFVNFVDEIPDFRDTLASFKKL